MTTATDTTLSDTLREQLEDLAAALLPEYPAPYVACYSDDADLYADDAAGWTRRGLCDAFRDTLADRWRGRAPMTVVDDSAIVMAHALGIRRIHPGTRHRIAATLVHELVHVADRETPDDYAIDPDPADSAQRPTRAAVCSEKCAPMPVAAELVGHGWRFARLAVHAAHRANLIDPTLDLWPDDVFRAADLYGLSECSEYASALGDEPRRMLGATWAQIKVEPLPVAFVELWTDDLIHWAENHDSPTDAAAVALHHPDLAIMELSR